MRKSSLKTLFHIIFINDQISHNCEESMKSPKPCYNVLKDKEKGYKMYNNSIFLITVTPEMYYGTPYHFAFRNEDKAKKKFDELVEKHNLCHDGSYRVAQRDSESLHHVDTVELDEIFYYD